MVHLLQDFKELKVWARSHQLVLAIYKSTAGFPRTEQFGVTNQVRRASASICANIAEGCGRNTSAELARFLEIAMGSASEVEYFLILARDLEYFNGDGFQKLYKDVTEVKRMLASLIQTVRG